MELLRQFYENENMRETVKAFLKEHLNNYALDKVMAREDVGGIADASQIIEKAFSDLSDTFHKEAKTIIQNKAR